jgi:hypothetical protein
MTNLPACDRRHKSEDFVPSAPAFQNALQVFAEALSLPADGASTVKIEAQISPDADADKRTVRFHTTGGSWLDPEGTPDNPKTEVERMADTSGRASATLRSAAEVGVALVTVSVVGVEAATVTREIEFTEVTGPLASFTVTPDTAFGDGTPVTLEATISADSPPSWNEVEFTTTAPGFFDNDETKLTKKVATEAGRVARAQLRGSKEGDAEVTAKITAFPEAVLSRVVVFTKPESSISVQPENLQFGEVAVNTTSDLVLTILNGGSKDLTLGTSSDPSSAFTFSGGSSMFSVFLPPSLPAIIAPGGSLPITVRFAPTAAGPQTGVLNIKSDDPLRTNLAVALAGGSSTTPTESISVSPASLDFGDVLVTETKDLPLSISNTGDKVLTLNSITSTNDRFALVGTAPASVPAGGTVAVTVRFTPDTAANESGVLNISSSDPQQPILAVPLAGVGVGTPKIKIVTALPIDFGDVTVGTTKDLFVSIMNEGTGTLTLSNFATTNDTFSAPSPAPPVSIAPGATVPVTIRFAPDVAAAESGVLNITSNDPVTPVAAVTLQGTGI